MSEVRPDIDLAGLARRVPDVAPPRRSPWRIILPLAILIAFLAVLATSLSGVLKTRKPVSVIRPRVVEAANGAQPASGSGRVVLQAAGWIEPDPFAIQVGALTPGIVREVLVREAARVARGDVVARLVDDDARLAVAGAEAKLAKARAEETEAAARAANAQANFDQALAVTENEATSRAELEGRKAELANREAALLQGEAGVRVARNELALQKELESVGAGEERLVDLADARVAEATAALEILRANVSIARAELDKAQARHTRAARDVELRLEDKLALSASAASLANAQAEVAGAQVALDEAKLRLSRTDIVAPADGVVLERAAMPGTALDPGAGTGLVCTLFDPAHLRVRVDVPQADVSKLRVGGTAEIALDVRAGKPYHGEIVRVLEKADIQKVTLQVHVRIDDGDEWVRPEMLAQVRFHAAPSASSAEAPNAAASNQRVEVPARVVDAGGRVWIIDGVKGTAQPRKLELGAQSGEWVEVLSGLDVSDKVIDEGRAGLEAGDPVRVENQP
ncbi:MAG TPA: efflux RND transporter periplasmic adaptor subunit [Planctomycetota bacterium]|nr:efflux RND transporter periplasmic adaptor subunit [Planctomycetota bacterium]